MFKSGTYRLLMTSTVLSGLFSLGIILLTIYHHLKVTDLLHEIIEKKPSN